MKKALCAVSFMVLTFSLCHNADAKSINTVMSFCPNLKAQQLPDVTLKDLVVDNGELSPVFAGNVTNYTDIVSSSTASLKITPTVNDTSARVIVNGNLVRSGSPSAPVKLKYGANTITIVVTAGKEATMQTTYTINVVRSASTPNGIYQQVSLEEPVNSLKGMEDDIAVHRGVSPNGDGVNDFLMIDGITKYPDNKLTIVNRAGAIIFETEGYNNRTRVFDGHSSKNGKMQLPGTYFYSLDYTVNGIVIRKTGFIVLKW
jgi:gliding motility-associated-like protein